MDASMLQGGFSAEFDTVDEAGWHALLDRFADASLYQAWAWQSAPGLPGHASRLVLRRDGEVVAAAQARVVRLPLLPLGVAYVRWGPMWRLRGRPPEPAVLAAALRALRDEYTLHRGLSLRVLPYQFEDEPTLAPWQSAAGFARRPGEVGQRTLLMPIDVPPEALRARMDQKWRNGLNRAERHGLQLEEGDDETLFARFSTIHREMRKRKGFRAMSDPDALRALQPRLPERHRMRVFLASSQGETAAGVVCSQIGDFGLYLHGATSDCGMRTQASYLLQWCTLQWLQQRGARCYNLHGIDPEANPGTYHFKAGLAGRAPAAGRGGAPAARLARCALGAAAAGRRPIGPLKTRWTRPPPRRCATCWSRRRATRSSTSAAPSRP